jgi:hypothetical protein
MKIVYPMMMVIGFILIAGTAGAWDHDLSMSITQFIAQMLIGISLFGIAIYNMR